MTSGRPLRVAFPFVGAGVGGATASTCEMVRRLVADGRVDPIVLLPRPGRASERFAAAGREPVYLDAAAASAIRLRESTQRWRGKLRAVPVYLAMRRIARMFLARERIDVVHVNEDRLLLPWGMAARQQRVPLVWHVRQERSNRLLDGVRLALTDHLVFVADANRSRFYGATRLPPSTTLHNMVDLDRFHPAPDVAAAKIAVGLDPELLTVTFVGNLLERKRPEWVLRATGLLQRDHALQVLLVGAPLGPASYIRSLHELASLVPDPARVHLLGARDDVPDLLRASDLVTLPSVRRGEAFPRVVIEAMACGVPVVATDVAGVREAVNHSVTGALTDPDDFNAYVAALGALVRDTEVRQQMGLQASRVARERFGGEAMGDALVALYRGLAGTDGA